MPREAGAISAHLLKNGAAIAVHVSISGALRIRVSAKLVARFWITAVQICHLLISQLHGAREVLRLNIRTDIAPACLNILPPACSPAYYFIGTM